MRGNWTKRRGEFSDMQYSLKWLYELCKPHYLMMIWNLQKGRNHKPLNRGGLDSAGLCLLSCSPECDGLRIQTSFCLIRTTTLLDWKPNSAWGFSNWSRWPGWAWLRKMGRVMCLCWTENCGACHRRHVRTCSSVRGQWGRHRPCLEEPALLSCDRVRYAAHNSIIECTTNHCRLTSCCQGLLSVPLYNQSGTETYHLLVFNPYHPSTVPHLK